MTSTIQPRAPRLSRQLSSAASQDAEYGGDFTQEEEDLLSSLLTQYTDQRINGRAEGEDEPECGSEFAGAPAVLLQSSPRSFASVNTLEELVQSGAFPAEVQCSLAKEPSSSQIVLSVDEPSPNPNDEPEPEHNGQASPPAAGYGEQIDTRSPLARLRARRPLSVTDLVSPAWCEIQYSYSLHRHGRKKRTPAMRQGSVAHQRLEEEVHATFKVEVMTKEDAWGLRLWNVIQGARTLRETGMTRELEVWGLAKGQLVNGVIDELSYECPDFDLELDGLAREKGSDRRIEGGHQAIEDFFESQGISQEGHGASFSKKPANIDTDGEPKVYLTDHKTRTVRSVPKGSAFKPTRMQLMIYRKLLSDLVSDQSSLEPAMIWERYGVNADTRFSRSFIDQFGETSSSSQEDSVSIPDTIYSASTTQFTNTQSSHSFQTQTTEPTALTVSLDDLNAILRTYPTPRSLWSRMIAELQRAIPADLGNVLRVEYWDQAQSDRLGSKNFLYDEKTLNAYLARTMQWWEGEREPIGVEVDEAWKCRICEFADDCSWRKERVEQDLKKFRQRSKKT